MPYIAPEDRPDYDNTIDTIVTKLRTSGSQPGHLNYVLTSIVLRLMYSTGQKVGYTLRSMFGGVLADLRDEFYRRHMAEYEDEKISEHGDV